MTHPWHHIIRETEKNAQKSLSSCPEPLIEGGQGRDPESLQEDSDGCLGLAAASAIVGFLAFRVYLVFGIPGGPL